MTGLPSASSATLVAGELDVRFVEHSVDGAERLGLPRTSCSRPLAAFADQFSTLQNCDMFLHCGEAHRIARRQRRHRLLRCQHHSHDVAAGRVGQRMEHLISPLGVASVGDSVT